MSRTVLVVDDEPAIRELVAEVLRQARGETVLTAGDVDEALSVLAAHPVALVITDIAMPGQSGLHLLCAIQARHRHTRTILMSGDEDLAQLARAYGADRWFDKGAHSVTALCAMVDELLAAEDQIALTT